MQTTWILYPMFAMVMLTLVIAMRMLQLRFRAVLNDSLNPAYFKLNRGGKAAGLYDTGRTALRKSV